MFEEIQMRQENSKSSDLGDSKDKPVAAQKNADEKVC